MTDQYQADGLSFFKYALGSVFALLFFIITLSPSFGQTSSPVPADRGQTLTLADCVLLALQNNIDLRGSYLDRQVQKFNLRVAEDKFVPQSKMTLSTAVSSNNSSTPDRIQAANQAGAMVATLTVPTGGAFSFNWNNAANREDIGQDYNYNSQWTLSFTQPLLKGGGTDVGTASVKIARIQEEQNVLGLKNTLISTINTTIQSYRSYLQAQRQLEINRRSVEMSKRLFETNTALIEAGRMAEMEIVQTKADIAIREVSLMQAQNNIESARLALLQVLSLPKETRLVPLEEKEVLVKPPSFAEAMTMAFQNRPDYLQTLRDKEVARLNFVVADRNLLWDLSLVSGVGANATDVSFRTVNDRISNTGRTDWNVGLRLTIPIRDLSPEQTYISARVYHEKTILNLKKLEINIGIELENALRDIEIKSKQVEMAKQARILSEQKLEVEQEKLKSGRSSNFQLLTFQNDLVNVEISELNARINYLNALTDLDQKLGTTLSTWKVEVKKEDEEIKLPKVIKVNPD